MLQTEFLVIIVFSPHSETYEHHYSADETKQLTYWKLFTAMDGVNQAH